MEPMESPNFLEHAEPLVNLWMKIPLIISMLFTNI